MITDYTPYADIRSILGVSDEEVSDTELALPIWSLLLDDKFSDISDSVATNFEAISLIDVASRTTAQTKFMSTASMYAAYAVAQELLVSLPMMGFKRVTDGKAEQERFDRWDDVRMGVEKGANAMRVKLRLALAVIDSTYSVPTAVTRLSILTTGLATDPITDS